ncbi:MAG: hypothetical protein AAGF47_06215 [Planctomycetota bacterium]
MARARTTSRRCTTICRAAVAAGLLVVVVGSVGCRRVLFRDADERSPYARYDRVRAGTVPPYVDDDRGNSVPNLRGRLLPQ